MSRIRIKNFGPIKGGNQHNDGWIDIKKVTVFIGNQGSGKSTVAKLVSTFMWIEKALFRGDYGKKWFERKNKLKNQFLNYHRLENYFVDDQSNGTLIEYLGEAYHIIYKNGLLSINEVPGTSYQLPQIMYVPAERNFIAYVKTPKELKLSSDSLKEFLTEFDNAKNELRGVEKIPVGNLGIEYDKLNDVLNLKGKGYKVRLTDASSGFQSLVPLYLVSRYLAKSVKSQNKVEREPMSSEEMQRFRKGVEEIWKNTSFTDEQKKLALSVLSSRFNKNSFINIVEEPEQNLFPSSQWQMLKNLLMYDNMTDNNKLIITTHSPYIINYLTISVQGKFLEDKIMEANKESLLNELYSVVPKSSLVSEKDVVVYQLDEFDGSIKMLDKVDGIPSDNNYLNSMLAEGNSLFDELLRIEQEI